MAEPITKEERGLIKKSHWDWPEKFRFDGGKIVTRSVLTDAYEAALVASEAEVERLRKALEPFAAAGLAIDLLDPSFPNEGAAMRASFDYYTRRLGRNNDEIVDRHSVTAGDFRRARAALTGEKP